MRFVATLLLSSVLLAAHPASASMPQTLRQRTLDFVRVRYTHGIPYFDARSLGSGALPFLRETLGDSASKPYWGNAAFAVGAIGDKRSFGILRNFVWHRFRGPVDDETLRALVMAQSSVASIPPEVDPEAEEYLWKSSDPAFWNSAPWRTQADPGGLGLVLSTISINALGWTGSERSVEHLLALERKPHHPQQRQSIAIALKRAQEIRRMGRERYLRQLGAEAHRKEPAVPRSPAGR